MSIEPRQQPPPTPREPRDSPLHQDALHESGLRHASGEALYVDDLPHPPGMLVGLVIASPHAHARITRFDAAKARSVPGVHGIFTARDIPGDNQVGPVVHDEPLFADGEVQTTGQSIALVVAESYAACRAAANAVEIDYAPLPAIFTIADAIKADAFLGTPHIIQRGDVAAELAKAPVRISGEVQNGGQDHFYLETQVTLAVPDENGALKLHCSTQHPSEVQAIVSHVLAKGRNEIVVEVPRMGGGFGGKETQAAPYAAMAALAASKLNRPVKVWLNRDQDMAQTGKRHPFWTRFDAGFDTSGRLLALEAEVYANGGWSMDLSFSILDRALFHLDNAYFIPALKFTGKVCRTNLPSNTAFRGFGGPQGMVVVETAMSRAAEKLGLDPAEVRARNFYGAAPRNLSPYNQEVKFDDNRLERIYAELMASSDYVKRRAEIDQWNRASTHLKRGIAFQPIKFGISFTNSILNQAGAFVLMYGDGSVQLNHGGTEMGQGLHTKMLAVCAHELGVSLSKIRAMNTATDKVPNTSATAASSGADLNGQAVRDACAQIRERLRPIAAKLLGVDGADVTFARDAANANGKSVPLEQVALAAYQQQIQLSAAGFYRTPNIAYDRNAGRGKPFHYFAYGAAVIEVELSGLTGEHRMTRVDILHDVGDSLVPTIDRGQVEGAFIQGYGWLTCEDVLFNEKGVLLTHSPDTYKIPAMGEAPHDFRVKLLQRAPQPDTIHGSKAVGEPPLMLAIGAIGALRHAIGAFAKPNYEVKLHLPATPESVLFAVEDAKAGR
ncbi:MAG: xanthine dehydrogenase molybdopterin binding subunit [Deltaproteobacteria bacterium]|nr:xanthine dehydrogenase molybdopterin binding subunit [Deltaproteobacteria bacterium]